MTANGNHHRAASRYPSGQLNGHRELIVEHTDAKNKWDGSATEFERKCHEREVAKIVADKQTALLRHVEKLVEDMRSILLDDVSAALSIVVNRRPQVSPGQATTSQ